MESWTKVLYCYGRKIKMNNLNNPVHDFNFYHCVYRDGFVFTAVTEPANVLDGIVIRSPERCDCWSPKKSFSERSLEEHINIINNHKLEKAIIIAEDISFIINCPTLKYIIVIPADTAKDNFDYSPLYQMPEIKYLSCKTAYGGCTEPYSTTIDYSKINGLKKLDLQGNGHLNYTKIKTLESINISNDKSIQDFREFGCSTNLKSIWLTQTALKSLNGIDKFHNLQQLVISYSRSLQDISELIEVADSLRSLSIENCPKIIDFSCLHKLLNLEHLELFGKNELANLIFLNSMKKLKTFSFSMCVADCDLSPCLNIPYVYSDRNKKQYNLKNKDLPKQIPEQAFELT